MPAPGRIANLREQRLMPAMHGVEVADRHDRARDRGRNGLAIAADKEGHRTRGAEPGPRPCRKRFRGSSAACPVRLVAQPGGPALHRDPGLALEHRAPVAHAFAEQADPAARRRSSTTSTVAVTTSPMRTGARNWIVCER